MKCALAAYGSRGDVEPCVAVARELQHRGHDVRIAVSPNMLGLPEQVGLAAVAYGPDPREQMDPAAALLHELAANIQDPTGVLTRVIERVSRVKAEKSAVLTSLAQGADLLVAGFNEHGLAANIAEYYRIPLAVLHFFPAHVVPSEGLYSRLTKETDNAQRRALGLPEATEFSTESASLEIHAYDKLCLPGLAAERPEAESKRLFVGGLTLELPTDSDDEVLSWIADGTPPIYFGFGSTPVASFSDVVAMISAACRQLGERALICRGENDLTHSWPSEHVKVVGAVNHAAIFPACRAVVHHGGAGTTAAGMRAGVPTLILWLWLDQPMWAAAAERLRVGFGRHFSAITQQTLVADLRSIRTPPYTTRAREVAAQMTRPAESAASAADLLEETGRLGRG